MENYIPTIENLCSIAESELRVMFRKAAEAVADENRDPMERAAAKQTMKNIRRRLIAPTGP